MPGQWSQPRPDRRFPAVVPVAVAAAGLIAIVVVQHVPNRHSIEDDLTDRSTRALAAAGLSDVRVDFTGRDGSLVANSSGEADRALAIVRGLEGVRVARADVRSATTPANPPAAGSPPSVNAAVDGGRVVLTGTVPTEAARFALVSGVEGGFGAGTVEDRLAVDPAVTDAGLTQLPAVIGALGRQARQAAVDLRGGTITLTGTVPSEAAKAATVQAATVAAGGPTGVVDQLLVAPAQAQLSSLPPVTFLDNSATLTAAGRAIVGRAAAVMRANPSIRVRIQGHTDDVGSAEDNLALSRARAQAVQALLRQLGIAADRVSSAGFGESRPRVPNTSDRNRAINRRVEFIVQR